MNKHVIGILASLALTVAAANAQTSTTISGKIADLATYVTRDHNMDAMAGHAMQGDAMHADAMHGPSACPASLGLVTSAGRVYLLATQAGSAQTQPLCKELGKTVSVVGTVFNQGGMSALLVK